MPEPIDYNKTVAITEQIRKEMPHLKSKEAVRREGARRAGIDYETFVAVRARRLKQAVPGHSTPIETVKPVVPASVEQEALDAYEAGWRASQTTKTYDLGAATDRFAAKHGRLHEDRFDEGWVDYAADYPKHTSFSGVKPLPKVTKVKLDEVRPGLFHSTNGKFEVENVRRGEWQLFELDDGYRGEWCQTFASRKDVAEAVNKLSARPVEVFKAKASHADMPVPSVTRWDSVFDDIKENPNLRRSLSDPMPAPRNMPLDQDFSPSPSWQSQKAWMDGDGKGGWPYNPSIRQAMGRRYNIEAHMPDSWGYEGLPPQQKMDEWANSFINAIEKQHTTQPPLYRGMENDPGLAVGDTFDMLPSSWSTDPSVTRQYGRNVFAVRDAYGVSLNEAKLNLADREVVAGGHMRVVEVQEVEWQETIRDVWGEYPDRVETVKLRVYVLEQQRRLP